MGENFPWGGVFYANGGEYSGGESVWGGIIRIPSGVALSIMNSKNSLGCIESSKQDIFLTEVERLKKYFFAKQVFLSKFV